ncbi:MAG: acylphosphatase, partial [Oscillospiraceae bacterium]|nr:acylphosphatase [Oscillospiraceae bacterium]
LTGWVKNLWDGRVEMEIQGDDALITHLLYELRKDRFIRITGIESEELPLVDGERDFSPVAGF